jgi:hypothetical protein
MIPGIDCLGAAKYKKVVLQFYKAVRMPAAYGAFAVEFGDAFKITQQVANLPNVPVVRIQLQWAGSSHRYTKTHLEAAIKLARKYNRVVGHAQVQLSPFCEHHLPDPDPWLQKVQDAAPSCTIVNNPQEGRGAFSRRFMNEIHTGRPPPFGQYNFSYDGQSACDADTEVDKAKYQAAQILFYWTWQLNCHYNGKDRERNALPTVQLMNGLLNLHGERGTCSLPRNTLWKSFAEQSDPKGDHRSNKPMCIYGPKHNQLELVRNGKVIGVLPRYKDPFVDGRQRYYLGQWGYEVATDPVDLRAGGEIIGRVNPGFRFGNFRDSI